MPIRPEFRKFYGVEWRAFRAELIAVHGPVCSACRVMVEEYVNLAHVTHDPRGSSVALMCAACHNRHDAKHRLAVWRRNRARRHGQLWLMPEIEYAATPAWMIPRDAFPSAQEELF